MSRYIVRVSAWGLFLFGLGVLGFSFLYLDSFDVTKNSSAVQITQVYTQTNYYVLLSIAGFAASAALAILSRPSDGSK